MSRIKFPPPLSSDENGILAVGGNLEVSTLLEAYSQGIFPWPHEDCPLLWFFPRQRGVLYFDKFHVPSSLQKFMRKHEFRLSLNENFEGVIEECAKQKRKDQQGTWINTEIKKSYIKFHKKGFAHSVECWKGKDLVGGLYGVLVKGVFSGESMFYKKTNASKLCVVHLVSVLKELGLKWMDIQMVTSVLETFGGEYISAEEYIRLLKTSQRDGISLESFSS